MSFNPFNPNSIVSSNLFAGRDDYVLRIIRKLQQVKKGMPSSYFLYGERGIGKTALAKLIMYIAKHNTDALGKLDFLVSYYSVDKKQSINTALQSSLNELTDQIPEGVLKILGTRLGKLLKNGKFNIGAFSVELKSDEERTTEIKDQLVSILSNLIESIRGLKDENKKDGILIVIDEMDNVDDIRLCAQLFRGIITTLDVKGLGNISFLIIGYENTLNDFYEGDPSARRQFDSISLGAMPTNEAKEVLTKGFEEIDVRWDSESLDKHIVVAGGYPHSIQLLGHNLIEYDKDSLIDEQDWVTSIRHTAAELQSKDFADMYNFHGKRGGREDILDVLAVDTRPLPGKVISKYTKTQNIYQYLPDLEKRGSIRINKETGEIALHSSLFRTAILIEIMDKIQKENYLGEFILRRAEERVAETTTPSPPS
jgi:hypothetical protein